MYPGFGVIGPTDAWLQMIWELQRQSARWWSGVWSALRLAVPDLTAVTAFATVDRRRAEPGLLAVVEEHGAPLQCYPAVELDTVDVPYPSESVRGHVGTRSVAEAAALLVARELGGGSLVVPKLRGEHVTVAVARAGPPFDQLGVHSLRGVPAHLPGARTASRPAAPGGRRNAVHIVR